MIKLFTHTDLDGIGCAILARLAFGKENIDVSYCNYDDINNEVENFLPHCNNYDMCFITDISINDNIAQEITDNYTHFYGLDHHPTALELNKYFWYTVQITDGEKGIKTSGTELFYHWLVDNGYMEDSESVAKFSELVRNYDTWRWAEIENGIICKQVNDLLYLYGREKFITWCISEIMDCVFPRLYAADELVLQIKQTEIDTYISQKNEEIQVMTLRDRICGFVFADRFISELGNKLCTMHPEIDFIAMIDIASNKMEYRAVRNDIDLGKDIAKVFGGGGHPKAAGSEFTENIKTKVIENIFGDLVHE